MAFQLSPGVQVTEIDNTAGVPSVATTAGAFSGAFQWGPVEEVTTVDTERSLVEKFGNPDDTTAGYFFTAANFLSYGNNLKLVRVVDKAIARNAVSAPSGTVTGVTLSTNPASFINQNDITVTFSTPDSGGTRATGNAILSSTGTLSGINMVLRGYGYATPPTISFSGGGGSGAAATAVLGAGEIVDIVVQDSGNNYSSASNIVIQNQQSTGASARLNIHYKLTGLQINSAGNVSGNANVVFSGNLVAGGNHATATIIRSNTSVVGFAITSMGNGYIGAPNVTISGPNVNVAPSVVANVGYGLVDTITVVNGAQGSYGYTPNITINKNSTLGGTLATATVRIEALISQITLDSAGSGWTSTPNVIITPATQDRPYVSNALAIASVGYTINRINIINGGSQYSSAPTVTIIDSSNIVAQGNVIINRAALLIENEDVYNNEFASGGFGYGSFAAKYPGTLGNSIKVSFADNDSFSGWQYASQFDAAPNTSSYVSGRGGSSDELHVIVVDNDGKISGTRNSILEKFSFVSKASDSKNSDNSTNYYKNVINNQSKYIKWIDHPAQGTNWGGQSTTAFVELTANVTTTLSGGVDGASVSAANVQAGYELFSNDELYDVSLIPMGPTTNIGVVNTVIGIAESRRDCIVFASPQYTDVVNTTNAATNVVNYRNQLTSSSFAVLDSGWKYQYDRYNDKYRYVPLNGDIAGLAARTDYIADPWFSPAGYNRGVIKNVVKLAYSPSKTDRDNLYKAGINPVVTFPGQGTLLFGDKTLLSRPSAFDRINVRRLFIVLEKSISTASKFQLFEFNDPFTRAQFKNLVEPFLRDVQGRRGITDFRVVCDETNNTADIVDRNEFVADIYIKPARAINFIQLNFVATRTGVSFEEVGA